jgi:hypothetical protein
VASALHTNFYEDNMPPDHVLANAEVIMEFVARLKSLL